METSSFLMENLPYSILIWLHFGTGFLISYSYILYVLPIVFNIVMISLPHFHFGFIKLQSSSGSGISGESGSTGTGFGKTVIPAELKNMLKDSKIFINAYSRNPKIFSSLPLSEVGNFFKQLDEKLSNMSNAIKGLPVEESDDKTDSGSQNYIASSTTDKQANISDDNQNDIQDDPSNKEKTTKQKTTISKPILNKIFVYGNIIFILAIVGFNIYGYFQSNNLFNEYFQQKKSIFKYSKGSYDLNYKKIHALKDEELKRTLNYMDDYVQIINAVKADKLRREKLAEEQENNKNEK